MSVQAYIEFCETLWSDWRAGRLRLQPGVSDRFQLDYMPEPYLRFGDGTKPFYVLFTNPGLGMPHQCRDVVIAGKSCIRAQMSYQEVSLALAEFYLEHLPPGHARANNDAMCHIRELLGADCVIQLESLPFHSRALPRKDGIPQVVTRTEVLRQYAFVLAEAMKDVSVVALSAVSSSQSISRSSVVDSRWLSWQASLLGVSPAGLTLVPLVQKSGKITSAFLYQKVAYCTRGFVLTMGGNTLPGIQGRELLARTLDSGS